MKKAILDNSSKNVEEKIKEVISTDKKIPSSESTGFMPATEQHYLSVYQGTPTNEIVNIGRIIPEEVNEDNIAKITQGRLTLYIENYNQHLSALKNSTVKLLQAAVIKLTAQNSYRREDANTIKHQVIFTLGDFMHLRGLKDRKEARTQLESDCKTLLALTFNWEEKTRKDVESFYMLKPVYEAILSKDGIITLSFAPKFALYLVNAYEMKLPKLYWRFNDKRNPNSSSLLYRLCLLKKMNRGRANEDIIGVETLLKSAPYIPSYHEVKHKTRHIVEPLERDLNAMNPALSWEYCNSKGIPLTDEQLKNFKFSSFIKLYIKVRWKDYPEPEYLEAQEKRNAKNKTRSHARRDFKKKTNS